MVTSSVSKRANPGLTIQAINAPVQSKNLFVGNFVPLLGMNIGDVEMGFGQSGSEGRFFGIRPVRIDAASKKKCV